MSPRLSAGTGPRRAPRPGGGDRRLASPRIVLGLVVGLVGLVVLALLVAPAPPGPAPGPSDVAVATGSPSPSAAPTGAAGSPSPPSSPGQPSSSAGTSPGPSVAATPAASPSATPGPTATPAPSRAGISGSGSSLASLLARLRTATERRDGYARSLFRHWIDADGDGCDTRREVLLRDAVVAPATSSTCRLSGGRWRSLYDGFTFTNARELDIDHVVALAEAWDSGARSWSPARRQAFANDLGVRWALLAVSATSNRSKSDKDPAEWMPPDRRAHCRYVAYWIGVKVRWGLTVDRTERRALERYVAACPTTRLTVPVRP